MTITVFNGAQDKRFYKKKKTLFAESLI